MEKRPGKMKARLPDPRGCPRVHPRTCVPDKIVSDLGSRSQPDTTWISKVAGCTADQAKRVTVGMVAHAGIVADLVGNIRRTGRVYYAQFPAPVGLYALVRLPGPTPWLKAE